jgi:FkbM family methyltransferase
MGIHGVKYYLKYLNFSRKIFINGVMMRIPSIRGITCNPTEPWLVELLAIILRSNHGAFLDVGVNTGQTLIKVKALDSNREYIGFEPNPACVFYVLELIKSNSFINCNLLPVGIFEKDGLLALDLFSDDETDSMASLINNFRPDHKVYSRIFVPVFRFDCLAKYVVNHVGIIKIDVEGAELEVVKSMVKLIQSDRPLILIEILPVYSHEDLARKSKVDELEQIFADNNYKILRILKTSENSLSGQKLIEKIGIHSDSTICDYLVIPNEKLSNMQLAL